MKITFIPGEVFPPEFLSRNKALNEGRGLSFPGEPASGPLAVIGGGPQIDKFVDELAAWPGEIWAINGAFGWCLDHGIKATFYSLDALPDLVSLSTRASSAILSDDCSPAVREAVQGPVYLVEMEAIPKGCTSACTAPMLAALKGYEGITLYGCESSFINAEHAYSWSFLTTSRVLVECGGREFLTTPPLIMQAEYLAEIATSIPGYLTVKGDGFLPALIKHGDYSVLKISRDIAESINGH
jgi:hypothetical protein